MSDQPPSEPEPASGGLESFTQTVQHAQISARVPEKAARGVFSTGVMVIQGPHEFVLDFIQGLVQPRQIAARVVLPAAVVGSLVAALRDNLGKYQAKFGSPKSLPAAPPGAKPLPIQEIYDQLKLPDEVLSGVYANCVMIAHSPSEFCFDFITSFYPRSAVSCRIYMAASQVPALLANLVNSFQQYQQKIASNPPPPQQRGKEDN